MNRLIVVSNRVAIPGEQSSAPGGLAVGVQAALKKHGGMWFGWSGNITNEVDSHKAAVLTNEKIDYVRINLTQEEHDTYYVGFSNKILWPLLHFVLGFMHYDRHDYEGYLSVNKRFARHLKPYVEKDDLLWVHDYHFIPLAKELRSLKVRQAIGFFLHVPFPGYDLWRTLPVAKELLEYLCEYDVVGFQTENDLHAFQDCVVHGLGGERISDQIIKIGERFISTEVCPIGIDFESIQTSIESVRSDPEIDNLMSSLKNQQLIIGADRLDYSKGLPERFDGYLHFLDKYPQYYKRWVYMQIATISRGSDPHYVSLREDLERKLGNINGRFGDIDWTPIRYLNKSIPHEQLMPLLRCASIGLVTSLRDGMNLVAKEFIASQDDNSPGVLVLSELAGAARELTGAVLVNPYDTRAIAEGIHMAIQMPIEERRERQQEMMKTLKLHDIQSWRMRFVNALIQKSNHNIETAEDRRNYASVS